MTHLDLFSAALFVLAVGFLESLSGRLDVFFKEAALNEADERAATGQRRWIVLDGWQDQSEHRDPLSNAPLTSDNASSGNTPPATHNIYITTDQSHLKLNRFQISPGDGGNICASTPDDVLWLRW